ncbi:mitochondrial processing peptidase beta subunit [Phlyctochytrium planicorne]|nr:mitochondrial processing peptidase beta subunit [Phlyctochytrium planicorne]
MYSLLKSPRLLSKVNKANTVACRKFASASLIGPNPSAASVSFGYRQSLGNVPETKVTRLSNGVTVATETNSNNKTATVGLWIKAGSRNETASTNGAAHLLEHVIFKGSAKRNGKELESLVGSFGGSFGAHTTREQTAYYINSLSGDVATSVELLADSVFNPSLGDDLIVQGRKEVLAEIDEAEKSKETVVLNHIHGSAFQGSSLGRTVLGSAQSLNSITSADLSTFLKSYYSPERIVLVGAGDVTHENLVKLAESHLGGLKSSGAASTLSKPTFVGSDVRARFDHHPTAHVAFAVEGASWASPDIWPLLVANTIVGNWTSSYVSSKHSSLKLAQKINQWHLADSFKSFVIPYSDTGLFGIYVESHNSHNLDDLTHYIQQEWHRLSMTVIDAEVFQAKNQLKASILASLDNNQAVAEQIGKQVLSFGKRLTPWELDGLIESVTAKDVNKIASKYIYDQEVAVVGYGPVESLSDYTRIRSAMSPIYW